MQTTYPVDYQERSIEAGMAYRELLINARRSGGNRAEVSGAAIRAIANEFGVSFMDMMSEYERDRNARIRAAWNEGR